VTASENQHQAASASWRVVHLPTSILALCAILIAPIHGAMAAPKYEFVDLGTIGGSESYAEDVNEHGVIVGFSANPEGRDHMFVYYDGRMTDVGGSPLPGDKEWTSVAFGINDSNIVVGYARSGIILDGHCEVMGRG